ncbi:hypothetical protein R1flu_027729 [Riccia fluitans]|uniref:Photosystem II core complex proteins psbY, chloroplastic n=1 Tax=Riccia fluitans TaxID=41844 RepID=A0ABD1XJQ9_9MARC
MKAVWKGNPSRRCNRFGEGPAARPTTTPLSARAMQDMLGSNGLELAVEGLSLGGVVRLIRPPHLTTFSLEVASRISCAPTRAFVGARRSCKEELSHAEFSWIRSCSCWNARKMAMATALAGSSLSVAATLNRSNGILGQGVQRLRFSGPNKASWKKLQLPAVSAKSEISSDDLSMGASALAGALFASMATSDSALAAQQIATLAADDNRALALLIPLVPAIGWVLFNILKPALNQIDKMRSAKGLVAGLGLGALGTLAFSSEAEAAVQEIAQVADNDSRGILLLGVLIPAIGWVLFNILQPALNQLNKMQSTKGVIGAIGLGGLASMLYTPQADAAQELAQIADSDSRGLVLLGILIPAVGWVLFNILQPALNQLNKMRSSKSIVGTVGIGAAAASLLSTQDAEAAQEVAQLAADNRPVILLVVLLPAIGWVLFNILRPALNQLDKMNQKGKK